MAKKNQSTRLTDQHKKSQGVVGIFGKAARLHDLSVGEVAQLVLASLSKKYPMLSFRYRRDIQKSEINAKLASIDVDLGKSIFVTGASIRPDGGLIEVQDDNGDWRIVLVSEAKLQGKDIENIKAGKLVGSKSNQDLMAAGNAIERSHKNIAEIANLMLAEAHFPYVLFLEGSNFLTETLTVARPDGRVVTLEHNSGILNRLDRLTAANYGMSINTNHCVNKFIKPKDKTIMLQAASLYTEGRGGEWDRIKMLKIMTEVAESSLKVLGSDLFTQLTANK
ncbi:EcoRI family type II restriction endonuclease [Phaeobacter inhibens]|uniref:EcoRI family type II restriction endonuclease n=1 Tax=Phaeobacter inhibens TaxID=221822 RepID=UPI000C9AD97D|nr:EcoRI family type II restriction endonuclease [Phaeobacter inhibens]AUQ81127.1 Type-2 restriction enzyme EcoRI [Phaeobacter inhibens]